MRSARDDRGPRGAGADRPRGPRAPGQDRGRPGQGGRPGESATSTFRPRSQSWGQSSRRQAEGRPEKKKRPSEREQALSNRPLREDLVLAAALEAYGSVRHDGRLADRALEYTLRPKKNLYSSERRAVAERVYALLRRQITVDHLLTLARPGYDAMPTTEKDVLRLSASRVLHGEDPEIVADSIHISQTDAAALHALPDAAARLDALPRAQRFAISASLPEFLASKFLAELGNEADALANAMNERAPLNARVNALKGTREEVITRLQAEEVDAQPTPLSPLGITLETRTNAFSFTTFREGFFELQDEGSQLLGMLVDPPPKVVVDACAGAGGKTLQLAAAMKNRGELFALDVDERRLEDLKKRARRAGAHNVRIRTIAPTGPEAMEALKDLEGRADRVLVDAPCTGTGTFRRKPDARYRVGESDLQMHVTRQKDLLERFSALVKPGGRLIYGTCSVLRDENEDVISDFLSRHPEFSVRPVTEDLGPELGPKVERNGFLRLFPHKHGTDGFFGAVLVKAKPPPSPRAPESEPTPE